MVQDNSTIGVVLSSTMDLQQPNARYIVFCASHDGSKSKFVGDEDYSKLLSVGDEWIHDEVSDFPYFVIYDREEDDIIGGLHPLGLIINHDLMLRHIRNEI